MAISLYRRTKDALFYPSYYFDRIRKESARPALAYYLLTEAILFIISYLPVSYFTSTNASEFMMKLLLFAPTVILGIFIATLLTHLAIIILNRGKLMEGTIKYVIYIAQPIRILGVVCAYITIVIAYLLFKSYVPEQFDLVSLFFTISGFTKTFAAVLIIFVAVYALVIAYAAFRMLVGMHKLLNISLERAFWTNVVSAILNTGCAVVVYILANKIF